MKKLTHRELVTRQENQRFSSLPFCAVLNQIRSLYNVGSIFRTADGAGLEKLWLCGITGIPPSSRISKTALGAEKKVPWSYAKSARYCIQSLKKQGYMIVLLEQTHQSIPYQKLNVKSPVCLIVGNEITGVSEDILSLCDAAVEIEMVGLKNSLNVTVAFGIVAYHIRHQMMKGLGVS
ncbi:MAG: RNA methyltransferase [Candidatus Omnitrophica bacterium]|nr:RNA methyltransferase [Candidatus Omnitrophota bacterium]